MFTIAEHRADEIEILQVLYWHFIGFVSEVYEQEC